MNKRRRITPTPSEIPVDCWRNVQEYLTQDEKQALCLVNKAIREIIQPKLNLIMAFINQRATIYRDGHNGELNITPIKFETPRTEYSQVANNEVWGLGRRVAGFDKVPNFKVGDVFIEDDGVWHIKRPNGQTVIPLCAPFKVFTLKDYPLAYWHRLNPNNNRTLTIDKKNRVGNKYYLETKFNGQAFWLCYNLDSWGIRENQDEIYYGVPTGNFSF